MRLQRSRFPVLFVAVLLSGAAGAQSLPAQSPSPSPQQAQVLAQNPGAVTISLDDAIQMALQHNHNLLAARTTIQQSEAEEITANLRPNPVLLSDWQFLPVFQPSQFSADYLDNVAQFDLGVSYLFERGKKRQHRLQAAKDQTAVTTAQVADNGRTLTFNVASQFIAAVLGQANLDFAETSLASFQHTVELSEASHSAGARATLSRTAASGSAPAAGDSASNAATASMSRALCPAFGSGPAWPEAIGWESIGWESIGAAFPSSASCRPIPASLRSTTLMRAATRQPSSPSNPSAPNA